MWPFKNKTLEKQNDEDEFASLVEFNLNVLETIGRLNSERRKREQKRKHQLKIKHRRKYYSGF